MRAFNWWLKTPEAAKARRRLYAKSWSRRRAIKGKDATEVRIERARVALKRSQQLLHALPAKVAGAKKHICDGDRSMDL